MSYIIIELPDEDPLGTEYADRCRWISEMIDKGHSEGKDPFWKILE